MNKKIMVVDDEEDNRISIKSVLEQNSFDVILAANGDECLEKIQNDKPDLILMDIMMPGTPVKEVVERINDIKICYLSVVRISEAEREVMLKKDNIIGYIQKPFDIDEFLGKVREFVGN